jgi:hypothetical protein
MRASTSMPLGLDTEEWIKGYVRNKQGAYPHDHMISELLDYAPHAGGPLYRGINLPTDAAWNDFVSKTKDFTLYEDGSVTSWTKQVDAAIEFCLTRPTYDLNRELMHDEAERSRNRDFMIGRAGVVLRLDIQPGLGIDLDKVELGLGSEAEVLMPPGRYSITLERIEVPFIHAINTANYGDHLAGLDPSNLSHRDIAKLTHIINRFTVYTSAQRRHLFELVSASCGEVKGGASLELRSDYIARSGDPLAVMSIWCDIPDEYVTHYDKFLPEHKAYIDGVLAKTIEHVDAEFARVTAGVDWANTLFTLNVNPALAQAVQAGRVTARFPEAVNAASAKYYINQTSMDATDQINDLPAHKKHAAITTHAQRIAHILNQRLLLPRNTGTPANHPAAKEASARRRRHP